MAADVKKGFAASPMAVGVVHADRDGSNETYDVGPKPVDHGHTGADAAAGELTWHLQPCNIVLAEAIAKEAERAKQFETEDNAIAFKVEAIAKEAEIAQ